MYLLMLPWSSAFFSMTIWNNLEMFSKVATYPVDIGYPILSAAAAAAQPMRQRRASHLWRGRR